MAVSLVNDGPVTLWLESRQEGYTKEGPHMAAQSIPQMFFEGAAATRPQPAQLVKRGDNVAGHILADLQ